MPVRVPHHTVVIHRDGKNIRPPIGQPFEFTQEEVDELHAAHPQALRRAVVERARPVTEVTSEEGDDADDADDNDATETRAAPRKGAARKAPRKASPVSTASDDDEL